MSAYGKIHDDPAVQEHYEKCLEQGTSPKLAELFALGPLGHLPGVQTDKTFMRGQGGCYNQFEGREEDGDLYRKMAEEAGVNISGRVYKGSLAQFPGDPRAWVDGKGDVRRVCEETNMSCTGAVTVKQRNDEPPPKGIGIADDLILERAEEMMAENPDLVPGERLWQDARDDAKMAWADKVEKE